jgi:hypothetical protein
VDAARRRSSTGQHRGAEVRIVERSDAGGEQADLTDWDAFVGVLG